MKVFLSHSTKDKDFTQQLSAAILGSGSETWLCELDVAMQANFFAEIDKGLKWCDVALLIWSPDAAASHWTEAEWTSILARQVAEQKTRLGIVLLRDHPLPELLRTTNYIDARTDPRGAIRRVIAWLEHREAVKRFLGLPEYRPQDFVGRTLYLEKLRNTFSGDPMVLLLCGEPGTGKSTLALQFALEAQKDFDAVVFQPCGQRPLDTITAELVDRLPIDVKTLPPDQQRKAAKDWLRQRESLLILDDVWPNGDGKIDVREFEPGPACSVLYTSRQKSLPGLVPKQIVMVEEFTDAEAMDVFHTYLDESFSQQEVDDNQKSLLDFAARVEMLPIALSVGASLLRDNSAMPLSKAVSKLDVSALSDGLKNVNHLFAHAIESQPAREQKLLAACAVCAEEGFWLPIAAQISELSEQDANEAANTLVKGSLLRVLDRDHRLFQLHAVLRHQLRERIGTEGVGNLEQRLAAAMESLSGDGAPKTLVGEVTRAHDLKRRFNSPPTPKVVSDQWVTEDTLGYEPYARAVANLITHPKTAPPLTIGIQAPWGAGKTSVMKMIQHLLDGDANLTEQSEAGKKNRPAESQISIRKLIETLKHPEFDARIQPTRSPRGTDYGVLARATVWFNAWKYQTSEQVWAGLAHCIINHVTVRMDPAKRELFGLKLNSRRVDVSTIRRKVYETVLHDLLPRVFAWSVILALFLVGLGAFFIVGGNVLYPGLARAFHWISPAAAALAGWDLLKNWRKSLADKLAEKARGDLLKLVREPDYEGKMGFLYLVESDVREVLDLVATPETPLVIFIDDLDRCVPHKVAEVVEAVSLFLAGDYPNCIFVLGMEPHVVAAALEVANSDLIKRMQDLGFGDESAPMGWRFMEKVVQLPLILPPPTSIGLKSYLDGLAPAKVSADSQPPPPPPEESQVRTYVETLSEQSGLSEVVEKTEQLLNETPQTDAAAIAEASKRVFVRKFDEHDPLVRKFVESAIEVFGANPRQVKRYVNLFRLYCNLRHSIWLDSRANEDSIELPSDDEITKFVTFTVQWLWAPGNFVITPLRDLCPILQLFHFPRLPT